MPEWLEIGVIAKPHGLNGGIIFKSYSGGLSSLVEGRVLRLYLPDASQRDCMVASVRPFKNGAILQLANVNLKQATHLRGAKVFVRRSDLEPLAVDEVFVADLMGLKVYMPDGQLAGVVQDAADTRPLTLIIVGKFSGTVPLHAEWLRELNIAGGTIHLWHPPIA